MKIGKDLSYKQLCILQFLIVNGQQDLKWKYSFSSIDALSHLSSYEPYVEDLDRQKLIAVLRTSGNTLSVIAISKLGIELSELMGLNEIAKEDIENVRDELNEIEKIIQENKN